MSDYETRACHGVKYFYKVLFDKDNKPRALALHEPDKRELRMLRPTDKIKITEVKL